MPNGYARDSICQNFILLSTHYRTISFASIVARTCHLICKEITYCSGVEYCSATGEFSTCVASSFISHRVKLLIQTKPQCSVSLISSFCIMHRFNALLLLLPWCRSGLGLFLQLQVIVVFAYTDSWSTAFRYASIVCAVSELLLAWPHATSMCIAFICLVSLSHQAALLGCRLLLLSSQYSLLRRLQVKSPHATD